MQKVRIQQLMSQMKNVLRHLRVAMTRIPRLIETIVCWQEIALHLHLKGRLQLILKGAVRYMTLAAGAPQLLQIKSAHMYWCETRRCYIGKRGNEASCGKR